MTYISDRGYQQKVCEMVTAKEHTKTTVKHLQTAHNKLGEKFDWYHKWHKHPLHRHAHYSGLIVFTLCALVAIGTIIPNQIANAPSNQVTYNSSDETTPGLSNQSRLAMLFDIRLTIDNSLLNKPSDLISRTRFESFGTVPTPVDLTYKIIDSIGTVAYLENDNVTVETEQLITKEFTNLDIKSGKYILVLTTLYGDNVKDEFKVNFEVKKSSFLKNNLAMIFWVISVLIVSSLITIATFRLKKSKKKEL